MVRQLFIGLLVLVILVAMGSFLLRNSASAAVKVPNPTLDDPPCFREEPTNYRSLWRVFLGHTGGVRARQRRHESNRGVFRRGRQHGEL